MKLVLNGHNERYIVEQSLMNLFPGELPVYEPIVPEDETWAVYVYLVGSDLDGYLFCLAAIIDTSYRNLMGYTPFSFCSPYEISSMSGNSITNNAAAFSQS